MSAAAVQPDLTAKLRPPDRASVPCKVCGGEAALFGVLDFNRNCVEERGGRLPLAGVPIYYRRCRGCGLVFTDAFDAWSHDDFRAHIYNDAYAEVDPDSEETRPIQNARWVTARLGPGLQGRRVLDYGGGGGRFCAELRAAGLACETYDPIYPETGGRPEGRFELVTCFETLEHLPDPRGGAADLAALTADDGVIFFSTLVQPADFDRRGLAWWYIGPRNGHITLYSRHALALLWRGLGFSVASFNDNLHMAFRGAEPPAFVREAFKPRAG